MLSNLSFCLWHARFMVQKNLLLIEDSESDVKLIQEAFDIAEIVVNISVVSDGDKAIEYLNAENEFKDSPRPELILLDLNLPKRSGHEILKYCRNNDQFKHIPVVMLTTSDSQKDINVCYHNQCSAYIVKPYSISQLVKTVKELDELWFAVSKLLDR